MGGQELDVFTPEPRLDTRHAFSMLVVRLGVEGYAFEVLAAVVAEEAFWMEAGSRS